MALQRKGRTHDGVSITTGASANADLDVSAANGLTLLADLTGAAAGDLTLEVRPYDDQGNVFDQVLPPTTSVAPALSSGHVRTTQIFELHGLDKVQVRVKNSNAGTQTAIVTYYNQR